MSGVKGTVVGFTRSDLYKFNSYYTDIWAVQVPPGYTLELFSDYHYGGTSKKTFTGELDTDGSVKCQSLSTSWYVGSAKLYNHRKKTFDELFTD